MFGIGKKSFNSSMTTIYLFFFILVVNQIFTVHSFRLMYNDIDQNEPDETRRAINQRLANENFAMPEDSSSNDNDLQPFIKSPVQRRFCCMTVLSGRKRSIRDISRKQIQNQ